MQADAQRVPPWRARTRGEIDQGVLCAGAGGGPSGDSGLLATHTAIPAATAKKRSTAAIIEIFTLVVRRCTFTSGNPSLSFWIDMAPLTTRRRLGASVGTHAIEKPVIRRMEVIRCAVNAQPTTNENGGSVPRYGPGRLRPRAATPPIFRRPASWRAPIRVRQRTDLQLQSRTGKPRQFATRLEKKIDSLRGARHVLASLLDA